MDISQILTIVKFAIDEGPAAVNLIMAIIAAVNSASPDHRKALADAITAYSK